MVSYLQQVKGVIKESDVLIEVVDARFPQESRNFELESLIKEKNKKFFILINKADLVPESFLRNAVRIMSKEAPTMYISSTKRHGTRNLFSMIHTLRKGKKVRIGVFGYPNVGKSTVINVLRGRHSAKTGSMPGITRGIQWVKIQKDIMLIDTPGVVPLRGKKGLLLKGAIGLKEIRDIADAIVVLLQELVDKKSAKDKIEKYYGLSLDDPQEFLEAFADKYNLRLKGNKPDIERAAKRIYNDWIKGKLNIYWF